MKFNLNDYPDIKWVMHCDNEEEAEYFCTFLHNAGRTWCTGSTYLGHTSWSTKGGGCCYAFNSGEYCDYDWFRQMPQYKILEFEDFEWDGLDFVTQFDTTYVDMYLNTFVVN